jgi:hypothetical protein
MSVPLVGSGPYLIFNRHLAIVLPSQSIAVEKDLSQPTTRRQLSFADLLSHLKHHNSGIRKGFFSFFAPIVSLLTNNTDAILGLREILESHWDILRLSLTNLVNALVRVIADEVRAFFAFHLLRPYRRIRMHPFGKACSPFCPGYYQKFHRYVSHGPYPPLHMSEINIML